jgi:hypothetical protein
MTPKSVKRFSEKIMLQHEHDPEKCEAVFGKDHAPTSMIPKSVKRFSEKIMLQHEARAG